MAYQDFVPSGSDSLTTSDGKTFQVPGGVASQFDIVFYNCTAEQKVLDKTAYLYNPHTITGTLRQECSITAPVITIQYNGVPSWNYAYIDTFGRYYYIRNKTAVQYNMWRIELNVDVLTSYRTEILALPAYIARNQYNFTTNIADNIYPTSGIYTQRAVSASLDHGTWNITPSTQTYFILAQCELYEWGSTKVTPYNPVPCVFTNYNGLIHFLDELNSLVITDFAVNPNDNIAGIYALPCGAGTSASVARYIATMHFAGVLGANISLVYTQETGERIVETWFTFDLDNYLESDTQKLYLNCEPYKTITLAFQPYGTFEIPYSQIATDRELRIRLRTDILTGDSILDYRSSTGSYLYLTQTNIAIRVPYTSSVFTLNATQMAGSVAQVVQGIATEKYGTAVAGGIQGTVAVLDSAKPAQSIQTGAQHFPQYPVVYIRDIAQRPQQAEYYGLPYYQYVSAISSQHGYTKCEDVHVEGISTATQDELEEIERILKDGFILSPIH